MDKKYNLNVFELAEMQLQKEQGKGTRQKYGLVDVFDYADKIRAYLCQQRVKRELAFRRWNKVKVGC